MLLTSRTHGAICIVTQLHQLRLSLLLPLPCRRCPGAIRRYRNVSRCGDDDIVARRGARLLCTGHDMASYHSIRSTECSMFDQRLAGGYRPAASFILSPTISRNWTENLRRKKINKKENRWLGIRKKFWRTRRQSVGIYLSSIPSECDSLFAAQSRCNLVTSELWLKRLQNTAK